MKRGGTQARNYVLHIPNGEKTLCGRIVIKVNVDLAFKDVREFHCARCAAKART